MTKPSVPEAIPIVRSLYLRHAAGCCWHLVLDDGNLDRSSVRSCVDRSCCEPECRQLAAIIPRMSATQLRKLRRSWWRS